MKKVMLITLFSAGLYACQQKLVRSGLPAMEPANTEAASIEALSGLRIYESKCGGCHELKNVRAFTRQRWRTVLPDMMAKAKLKGEEQQRLIAFIFTAVKE